MKAKYYSLFAVAALLLPGCSTHGGGVIVNSPGTVTPRDLPPEHAPAHGRRAQQRYHYHYFPDAQVYFDLDRKLYFYISANRWRVSVSLPDYLKIRLGDRRVTLELDIDKPYHEFHVHKKRYPPGQYKKKTSKGKGKEQREKNAHKGGAKDKDERDSY